ncbi:exopolyphosphatase PRUNE1-like isoform X1 [Dioscorea cayenensis subsp. rotundata]|uniref:Exopolyphosphatase PRUNE1-like isoform X1 n=1 Tax=Dioscorea cayennensis subsp. rotundata TaxID=55577 RepID=A0AB40AGX7_DIOCR|nr:exopolyphosphatase PRUNE1-like isoform X1 [Dioscorea cayenensis subsp. rotundata]
MMNNSNQQVLTQNFQEPFARKRDHPLFEGIRRSVSMVATQENASISSLTHSLSSIWEFESKISTSDTVSIAGSLISEIDDGNINQNIKAMDPPGTVSPHCAASFYSSSNPSTKMCSSVAMLNEYLRARKDDITAGVPGMLLFAVIGQEDADIGSVVSTILYAYFLNEARESRYDCFVPVINMERDDLRIHPELNWLLHSCQIEVSSLVFIDEIDLTYFDVYGSLNLVLVNGHKLPRKQEGLKEALVETINSEDSSICTFVAEQFAETSPEILAGIGICRLLLSGILLDTSNLMGAKCTDKDKYMTTLLIKGAGQLGINGLYQTSLMILQ